MDININEVLKYFQDKTIPIIEWSFLNKNSQGLYSLDTWSGWNEKWIPIASNVLGDVIIWDKNAIFELQHDTDNDKPLLVTKDISALMSLLKELLTYEETSGKDTLDQLKEKKEIVQTLKKSAPKALKNYFSIELDNIKENISDVKYNSSKEGKFREEGLKLINTAFLELQQNGKYSELTLGRHDNKFIIFYELKNDESLEEIKSIFEKYPLNYPVEYQDISDM